MLSALAKYVINRLIHGFIHIALVISPRLISSIGLKPSGPISRSRADNKGNMKKGHVLIYNYYLLVHGVYNCV